MSRHLFLLGLIAVPAVALSACEGQSTLAKAKPGECYSVVGKDATGQARLAKTACAGSPAALAAACPTPAPASAAVNAACPTGRVVASGKDVATAHKASSHAVTARKSTRRIVQASTHARARTATRSTARTYASRDYAVARSGEVTSLGLDYARVDTDLAGGPTEYYSGGYARRDDYVGGSYERRERYGRVDHLPPPPPPPPPPAHYERRGARVEYSERSRQSGSYSESYSSSSYGSRSGGYGRVECDCDAGGRGQAPHSPFDGYGYLTWRGKTPG